MSLRFRSPIRSKHVILNFFLFLLFVSYVVYFLFSSIYFYPHGPSSKILKSTDMPLTIILRQFQLHDNDIGATAQSLSVVFPHATIWIVYDDIPYPPLDLDLRNKSLGNIKLYNMSPRFTDRESLLSQINTKYVLFVPDSTRIVHQNSINELLIENVKENFGDIIASPVGADLNCLRVNLNQREWTLKYHSVKGLACDAISGKHLIIMKTQILRQMFEPFSLPFPEALYVQTSVLDIKVKIVRVGHLHQGNHILFTHYSQFKKKQSDRQLFKSFYQRFKIKLVIRETGSKEWYGCTKDTERCFGPVLASAPSYLYENKWTPPCCMAHLRETARHVLSVLDEAGIRYWLELGSLLGAVRSGDILPWDYNVDIGFIKEDANRSKWLLQAQTKSVVDVKGFSWRKAADDDVFTVSYSSVNNIHINLFPFILVNARMVPLTRHKKEKNMTFPESFLHPMASIDFVGRRVPSPNNIRTFLELKYGKGCIEKPQYPKVKAQLTFGEMCSGFSRQ